MDSHFARFSIGEVAVSSCSTRLRWGEHLSWEHGSRNNEGKWRLFSHSPPHLPPFPPSFSDLISAYNRYCISHFPLVFPVSPRFPCFSGLGGGQCAGGEFAGLVPDHHNTAACHCTGARNTWNVLATPFEPRLRRCPLTDTHQDGNRDLLIFLASAAGKFLQAPGLHLSPARLGWKRKMTKPGARAPGKNVFFIFAQKHETFGTFGFRMGRRRRQGRTGRRRTRHRVFRRPLLHNTELFDPVSELAHLYPFGDPWADAKIGVPVRVRAPAPAPFVWCGGLGLWPSQNVQSRDMAVLDPNPLLYPTTFL